MEIELKKLMASTFEVSENEISEDCTMDMIDSWDSLKHIELMAMIEDDFEIVLETEEMIEMTSFQSILNTIKLKSES